METYPFSAFLLWCAVFLTFLTLNASSTIRLGAFSLLMKGQDTSAATVNLLQNAIIDRLQSINTTARPPLHSLVKNNTIIGNVEFLLDFAVYYDEELAVQQSQRVTLSCW